MNSIIAGFREVHPSQGEVAICRLGQHSFLVKLGETLIAVDPFLTAHPKRLFPTPVTAEELIGVEVILGSHDHIDHIDRQSLPGMALASPNAKLIVPEAVLESIDCFPRERTLGLNEGKSLQIGDVKISAIASAHEFLDQDAQGRYPYLGFIIQGHGVTIYHSGDCCNYEGLLSKLTPFKCDIMILPINGRDASRYARNCIGNMTYQEAADLAGWLQCPLTIPGHYDMFTGNTEAPENFTAYMGVKYPQLKTAVLPIGEIRLFRRTEN